MLPVVARLTGILLPWPSLNSMPSPPTSDPPAPSSNGSELGDSGEACSLRPIRPVERIEGDKSTAGFGDSQVHGILILAEISIVEHLGRHPAGNHAGA
jgi:hypothetical protein